MLHIDQGAKGYLLSQKKFQLTVHLSLDVIGTAQSQLVFTKMIRIDYPQQLSDH